MAEEWMQKNWSMFQAEEEDMETDVIPYGTEEDVNKVDIPFQAAEGMEKFVISFLAEEGQVKEIIPLSLSPKNPKLDGGSVRRNSMGNRVQKSVPSYLRASSSSCHDFCKYGREHSFSKKEKQVPWRHKAVVSTTASAADSQIVTKNLNIRQQKKKPVVKPEPSIPKQTAEESSGKQKIIKAKDISAVKKIKGMDTKPTILSKSKLSVINSLSSQLSPSEGISSRRNSLGNGPLRHLGGSSTRRLSGISPIVSSGCLSGRTEKKLSNLSEASNGKKRSNGMPPKRVGLLKAGERKKLEPSTATLSPRPSIARLNLLKYRNTKASSPVSNQSRVGKLEPIDNKISVKTLYMIESKPEIINKTQSSASFLPSQLSLSSRSSISSCDDEDHVVHEPLLSETEESDIEQDYVEAKNSAAVPNNGDKRRLRSAISHLEGKDGTPQKLLFRRGKVVNLQSENNGPRRLRFRQGRVLSETAKVDLEKRSFRRKKELYGMELDKTNVAPPPIVLKHQDVQGKKEEQGLFNDVIEETANKLVETRKSKVKALVGAFETVISLHESKQSTTP